MRNFQPNLKDLQPLTKERIHTTEKTESLGSDLLKKKALSSRFFSPHWLPVLFPSSDSALKGAAYRPGEERANYSQANISIKIRLASLGSDQNNARPSPLRHANQYPMRLTEITGINTNWSPYPSSEVSASKSRTTSTVPSSMIVKLTGILTSKPGLMLRS